ncbi:PDDEXK nuclease domain-containing protein [Butyrivibrio sp. WCD3002]|uniref:PDDEXK nuclease domain-containing protein n=1 Tax=Butyrivibrio sp. WCD3002 TaxID=1280676 RepID=UPI0009DB79DB
MGFYRKAKRNHYSRKTSKFDLLFYHINLRCYVVLELKVKPFDPEFPGKLNFYINAVNEFVKRVSDNATIGLLIYKIWIIQKYNLRSKALLHLWVYSFYFC